MAFSPSPPYLPRLNENGFTLLELLIVVFILASLAFSTISLTTNADEQFRYEDTRTRLAEVRRAIIGDPIRTLNGEPAISGFVADMGRLPECLWELVQRTLPSPIPPLPCPQTALPPWSLDASGLWGGWRGPYLSTLSETGGTKAYRDGWGNAGAAPNYGWDRFTTNQTVGTIDMKSLGADGIPGDTDPDSSYDDDYPAGFLVEHNDHQVNIQRLTVTVTFDYTDGPEVFVKVKKNKQRIRIYYPQDGSFDWTDCTVTGFPSWPPDKNERDAAPYLSSRFPLADIKVYSNPDDGPTTKTVTVSFEGNGDDKWVPWGIHALGIVNVKDPFKGCSYDPQDPVTVEKFKPVALIPRTELPLNITLSWDIT